MANPIAMAAMLARQTTITCPYCKHQKRVPKKAAALRVCPNCKRKFDDPVTTKKRK
jgi:transposase-like protein